jgi:hypothetical protein
MLAQIAAGLELAPWEIWVIPLAGLASAGLVWLTGRVLANRRRVWPVGVPHPVDSVVVQSATPAAEAAALAQQRDPFLYGSPSEQRSSLRRRGKSVKVLLSMKATPDQLFEGWVIDRSVGGLCLASSQEVPKGAIMNVRPMQAPESLPWIQIEIKNCRQDGNHWEIGCQFLRTPVWSVLLLFG